MTQRERVARVPLAVEAQTRVLVGPATLPVRSLLLAACISPAAFVLMGVRLPGMWNIAAAAFLLCTAASVGVPEVEGVWLGTFLVYRHAWRLLPSLAARGSCERALVRNVDGSVHVARRRAPLRLRGAPSGVRALTSLPAPTAGDGILSLAPGGHHAVLCIEGPAVSVASDAYVAWCDAAGGWLASLDCPAQLLTLMTHHDSGHVGDAFLHRVRGWPATPLRDAEHAVVSTLAATTLHLRHCVVLSPCSAAADGVPHALRPWRARPAAATRDTAERARDRALRLAPGFGLRARRADRDDITAFLAHTAFGAAHAAAGATTLHIGGRHHVVITVTRLPAAVDAGCAVEALTRAQAVGAASLHVLPVALPVARRHLRRRASMLRFAQRRGADSVESAVALADTNDAAAALAQRDFIPCRVALTVSVSHVTHQGAQAAAERLRAALLAQGFAATTASTPGFLPALALTPGFPPLRRSLVMTSLTVAARLLPCLGTPFGDVSAPLVGINLANGAPAHHSVWTQANHNMVVVGSSGAGKSVAVKTMLLRHAMEGVQTIVVDPDSEYRLVMRALGGGYVEVGDDALNPLDVAKEASPDSAAAMVLPILSVMSGDDRGVRDGRPIRRLPDEDQSWLHGELVDVFAARAPGATPILMRDVVRHLHGRSAARALSAPQRERCRIIASRLERFTQGRRADVFDRASSFTLGGNVAVGLRSLAMTYGADLTPALAVVLTALLDKLARGGARMLIVVDEAHRVTSDPDAGEVLAQLVRQARKHGAGVWMVSQQVEDFVGTDLGRTLAATAATKLVLGTEEAALATAGDVFHLTGEELAALSPVQPGRGVLVAGADRAVVSIVPGPAILAVADTSAGRVPAAAPSPATPC